MHEDFSLKYEVELRSPQACQYAALMMPLANHLAYLPMQAKKCMPPDQFERIMAEMEVLLAEVASALQNDRATLTKKQSATSATNITRPVRLIYSPPIKRRCRCCHAISNTIYMILKDLLELDEQWCSFAWNADCADNSQQEFQDYLMKQKEWLDRIKSLTSELKKRKKQLRHACYLMQLKREAKYVSKQD